LTLTHGLRGKQQSFMDILRLKIWKGRQSLLIRHAIRHHAHNRRNGNAQTANAGHTAGPIVLKIFNISKQEIATLIDGRQNAGAHQIQWQAPGVPNGVYFHEKALSFKRNIEYFYSVH